MHPVAARELRAAAPRRRDTCRGLARWLTALGVLALGSGAWAQDQPAETARFEVVAVVLEEDGQSSAFMVEPRLTQGALRKVVLGESVGPYRLVGVASDHVVMEGPDGASLKVPFGLSPSSATATSARASRSARPVSPARLERRDAREQEDPAVRAARITRLRERAAAAGPTPVDGGLETVIRQQAGSLPPATQARLDEWMRLRERRLRELESGPASPAQSGAAR